MEAPLPSTARRRAPSSPPLAVSGRDPGRGRGPCRGPLQPLGAAALPRFLARSGAGAAAGCAAVHGVGLHAAPHPGAAGTAVLAAACLPCAVHLWRQPGRAAWAAHVVLTTAMLAVHPPVVTTHHAATGLAAWTGPVAGLLAIVALLLAAVRCTVSRLTTNSDVLVGGFPSPPSPTRVPGQLVPRQGCSP
jgi:hypothetical protein